MIVTVQPFAGIYTITCGSLRKEYNHIREKGDGMKLGLVKKIVIAMVGVSMVTYGTSAFFIFYLKDIIAPGMKDWLYVSIVLSLGIFWTGLLGWIGASWLIKPLVRLTAAANEAADGNLLADIPLYRGQDEIRQLSESFRHMIAGLRQMIADISSNAAFTHDQAGLLSGGMLQAARQIELIAGATDTIAAGAGQQNDSAQSTLATVSRIELAAAAIGKQAEESQRISREMMRTIAQGEEIVRSLVDGMMSLAGSNRESIGFVRQLDGNAKEIRSISQAVKAIADQTNLLALNASIEAARAGTDGQGFAVVAGEIRKLAEQSSHAVSGIDELITGVESGIAAVVAQITAQEQLAIRESGKGAAAGEALDRIDQAVGQTAQAVDNIAAGIVEQIGQVGQAMVQTRHVGDIADRISTEIKQVAASVQEQMAVMQELSSSSDMLKSRADALQTNIKVFRC